MTTNTPLDFQSNQLGLDPNSKPDSERCIHQGQCPSGSGLTPKVNGGRDDVGARQPFDEKRVHFSMAAMHLNPG